MPCDDADLVAASLAASAAAGIASVTIDGNTTTNFPLRDLVAYEKYLRARCAARSRRLPLRFVQLKPPGAA